MGASEGEDLMSKGHLKRNQTRVSTPTDLVFTAPVVAAAIVDRYSPTGRVLDPCEGGGAFSSLIPGCLTCEITKGTDFFAWTEPVDWIVGNPPYSILNEWLAHSFTLAHDIVYLLPIAKVFGSRSRLKSVTDFGLVEVWTPWTGRDIGFPFGWACGAVHMRRGHKGPINIDINL